MSVRRETLLSNFFLGFTASHLVRPEHRECHGRRCGPVREDGRIGSRWNHGPKLVGQRPRTSGRVYATETSRRFAIVGASNQPIRLSLGRAESECDPIGMRRLPCCLTLICTYSAHAAEFEWIPVSATGTHTINGNTIVLVGGGQQVTLELHMSGWDPNMDSDPLLGAFQAININDVFHAILAFQGQTYEEAGCLVPCP